MTIPKNEYEFQYWNTMCGWCSGWFTKRGIKIHKPRCKKNPKLKIRADAINLLFRLTVERDLRCGNGAGAIIGHSTGCLCQHLDPLIEMLKYNIKNANE